MFVQMSRCSSFRCSKFRHVLGKPSSRERSYNGVPITRSVHDNHFCSVNPCFVAVVTECAGGGSFLVLPIHHVRRAETAPFFPVTPEQPTGLHPLCLL